MPANQYGVIFDMDGVLVESTESHFVSWTQLGTDIGTPFPRDLFDRTFGMHNRQILPLWLGEGLDSAENDRLSAHKEALYREAVADSIEALPGARELVRALHDDGFALAVGSSAPRANVELVLRQLDLESCFQTLSTGDEVEHGKPHPEVFLKAIDGLGLEAQKCVVFEDAPQGVEAALAAGAYAIGVASTRPGEELAGAHVVVSSLKTLGTEDVRQLLAG
jgi:beta-phosphoglucomutase family hydrolase